MSFFLIFLAIILIGVAVLLGTGVASKVFRRGAPGVRPFDDGFDEPVASLPPVGLRSHSNGGIARRLAQRPE